MIKKKNMSKNKVITSEGNVRFEFPDTGKIINAHPNHIYTSFNIDTVSFMLIALPKSSGLSIMTSRYEDLELDGVTYSFEDLPQAIADALAKAGGTVAFEIVDELPASGNGNTFYLLRIPNPELGNIFEEYIWVENAWELVGSNGGSSIRTIYVGTSADSVDSGTCVINKVEGKKEWLNIVYVDSDGFCSMTKVNLGEFILENEFESGVTVNADGIVYGVVDERQPYIITEWNDDGTSAETKQALSVNESGFTLDYVQDAIDAKHANTIKLNGYVSGLTEDLFEITSGDTVTQAFEKIENKLYKDDNNGLIFEEGSDDTVILDGGDY